MRQPGAPAGSQRLPIGLVTIAAVVVALVLAPLGYLAIRAAGAGGDAWGILGRTHTWRLFANTLGLAGAVAAGSVMVGVPLAWLVARTDLPLRRMWSVAAALPLVIPSYVAALALLGAFGPRGLLQSLLESPFGVERLPDIAGFPGALLALVLSTFPFVFLLSASALANADPALEEASRALGLGPAATFWRVTIPMLRRPATTGALIAALYAISDFGAVSLMQYDALTRAVYLQYRASFDRAPAIVLAVLVVALTAVVLALEGRARGRAGSHRTGSGAQRQARQVTLGRWRWPAFAWCTAVLGMFLAVPLAVLGWWLGRGLTGAADLESPLGAALRTLAVSGVAATIAVLGALPVALLARRVDRPWARGLARLPFAANALPGIVVALSLVYLSARWVTPLYQTVVVLIAAYVVRYFSQAVAGVDSVLGTISPRLEEAARGLGRRPLAATLTVTLPLAAPGVLAGGTLVFLSVMKELPATLLLRPIGFDTLATEVWGRTTTGSYSAAALPALVLIGVATPFLWWAARPWAADRQPPA